MVFRPNRPFRHLAPLLLPVLFALPLSAQGIAWEASWGDALERARAESRVLLLAVNMDGEAANTRMATKVYRDKRIRALAAETVPVIASTAEHAAGKDCPRFGSVTCGAHREIERTVRAEVLSPDSTGHVVAPQHVFLNGAGEVLLSVPYELRTEELEWCFHEAFNRIGYSTSLARSAKARAPRRLIDGAVLDSSEESAPLTLEEARELIDSIKRGLRNAERWRALRRLLSVDEEEVADFVRLELRGGGGGGRRGGGRRGGGNERARTRLVRAIGERSPERYWSLLVELLNDPGENVRSEIAVALEQLAAEDSTKEIASAIGKEKDEIVQARLLRALGSAGAESGRTRKQLSRYTRKKTPKPVRLQAVLALGYLGADPAVAKELTRLLDEEDENLRAAALLAMGLGRHTELRARVQAQLDNADPNSTVGTSAEAALRVIDGGGWEHLRFAIEALTKDDLPRARLFGGARGTTDTE